MNYKTQGEVYKQDNLTIINDDCMNILKQTPDNYYDLCLVDPPYGIGRFGNRVCNSDRVTGSKINQWDIAPPPEYFEELFRVSKNQLIWGANNFILPKTEYFCIWDKEQTVDNFASAEYCWVSMGLKKPAKVFRYSIHKTMSDRKGEGGKIHPTQKPVKLYNWIYQNYAEPGQKILDSHLGSGSNAIAAHYAKMGEFVGVELDKDYFQASVERIRKETRQLELF
jgi:site-specific DNA-methyltransferase (adenine-specific)